MFSRQAMEEQFGKHVFAPAVFYRDERGLRFELSANDRAGVASFTAALKKSDEITRYLFSGLKTIEVCLVGHGEAS